MGMLGDRLVADYFGHRIEVEGGVSGLVAGKWRLLIDNEKVDEAGGWPGEHSLRGMIQHEGAAKPVAVIFTYGLLGTNFKLLVDKQPHPIQRVK